MAARKHAAAAALLLLAGAAAWGYEASLPNLTVPSGLEAGQLDLLILHRFYGSLLEEPFDTFLGMALGANVGFGARFLPLPGLQLRFLYSTQVREIAAGAGYGRWFPAAHLGLQADARYLNREGPAGRAGSLFASLSAQSEPILKRLRLSGVVGWDSRLNRLGLGTGLIVELLQGTPALSLVGELYPFFAQSWERHPEELGAASAFAFGLRLDTWGHQFSLLAGNSYESGESRLMAGAPAPGGLYLGFNIQRRFSLF
jgi:hypothetical protein